MLKEDALFSLIKDTEHLPESSFYLGVANVLGKEASKEIPKIFGRQTRCKIIEEVEEYLQYAITLFAKDKKDYQDFQKQGFLERKLYVDKELKKLQVTHIKMLIKELVVV